MDVLHIENTVRVSVHEDTTGTQLELQEADGGGWENPVEKILYMEGVDESNRADGSCGFNLETHKH